MVSKVYAKLSVFQKEKKKESPAFVLKQKRKRKWENVTAHTSVSVGKFQDSSDSRQNAKYKFGVLENLKQPLLEQSNPKLVLSPVFSNGICSWASENNQAFQLDISLTSEK